MPRYNRMWGYDYFFKNVYPSANIFDRTEHVLDDIDEMIDDTMDNVRELAAKWDEFDNELQNQNT